MRPELHVARPAGIVNHLFGRQTMKRYAILILILTVGLLPAADDPKQAAVQKELGRLHGQWELVSVEKDGKTSPPDTFKGERVLFQGDQRTVKKGDNVLQRSTLTIDPTAQPKTFEFAVTDGINKGMKKHGIYELDGDTLRICQVPGRQDRPKEFASKHGASLLVLKRIKP
jgi:uncharacterized protein (TIGR03067 family)